MSSQDFSVYNAVNEQTEYQTFVRYGIKTKQMFWFLEKKCLLCKEKQKLNNETCFDFTCISVLYDGSCSE